MRMFGVSRRLTSTILQSMIQYLINGKTGVISVRPVIWRHVLGILFTQTEVVIFVVVRDLGSTAGREAYFASLRCTSTGGGGLEVLPVLLSKKTASSSAVHVVVGFLVAFGRRAARRDIDITGGS